MAQIVDDTKLYLMVDINEAVAPVENVGGQNDADSQYRIVEKV